VKTREEIIDLYKILAGYIRYRWVFT